MKALQFFQYGPPRVLEVAEVAEPHAGPGQIRVAVRASGVTPADGYFRSGRFQDWIPLPLRMCSGWTPRAWWTRSAMG